MFALKNLHNTCSGYAWENTKQQMLAVRIFYTYIVLNLCIKAYLHIYCRAQVNWLKTFVGLDSVGHREIVSDESLWL